MDLTISQMMRMQQELFEKHKDTWTPMEPQFGRDFILYMIEEVGEVIAILKKKGHTAIMEDEAVRRAFLTEMADVLMYYHETLLRFGVTPEEISRTYSEKHGYNMQRDYESQYKEIYNESDREKAEKTQAV